MATKKLHHTLTDYVAMALSPGLIMALVGSLVFFLLEVLYAGRFSGRLQWTLFFFVFGAVLVARIAMHPAIGDRAGMYGAVLGGAVYLSLLRFADYQETGGPLASFSWAINLGLMALIWWCANKLTWDCTYIDDNVDASGAGVLAAAGLDEEHARDDGPEEDAAEAKPVSSAGGLFGWFDRYRRYRAQQRRQPHTPGVWVVYFSLAALPLFGLGQALIPADALDRRRYVFWLMAIYVASGLGLLVTTSFLGLRRYLRQRNLQMPAAMTGVWMGVGGVLIVAFLVVGALLPRPNAEYRVVDLTPLGSKDRQASNYAVKRDGAGKGEGRASSDPASDDKAKPGDGTQRNKQGGGQSKGKSSGQRSSADKSGQKSGQKSSGDKSEQKDGSRSGKQQGDDQGKGKAGTDTTRGKEKDKEKQKEQGSSSGGRDKQQEDQGKEGEKQTADSRGSSSPSNPTSGVLSALSRLANVLKWIVFGLLALVVVFVVLRSGLKFLANFTDWAKNLLDALRAWWEGLFGGRTEESAGAEEGETAPAESTPRPFASFSNPFLDGRSGELSPDELTRYTFAALEAWAWERGLGRSPEETPLEFVEQLVVDVPALESDARKLVSLYAHMAYGRGRLTAGSLGPLKQFWTRLEAVAEQPLSS